MGWLQRRRAVARRKAIEDFWAWWPKVAEGMAILADADEADETPTLQKLRNSLDAHVRAIAPQLSWMLADGLLARHALVLSGEGAAALRVVTERWRRAGPRDSDAWEFHASRPPNPGALYGEFDLGGRIVLPREASFNVEMDEMRGRVHVDVCHPAMSQFDRNEQLLFAFLLLDWILGEDDVERWIGEVHIVPEPGPYGTQTFREPIDELRRRLGAESWAELEGIDPLGRRIEAMVRIPWQRPSFPLFDQHCALNILLHRTPSPQEPADPAFEPDLAELAEVEELVGKLLTFLGDSVHLAAIETHPDRRIYHFYGDSEGTVSEQLATWLASDVREDSQSKRERVVAEWSDDPGWDAIRRFFAL